MSSSSHVPSPGVKREADVKPPEAAKTPKTPTKAHTKAHVAIRTRSLWEEYLNDVLFYVCVTIFGLSFGATPWITCAAHFLCSGAALGLTVSLAVNNTWLHVGCGFLSIFPLLTDIVFVSQLQIKVFNKESSEPVGFVAGVGSSAIGECAFLMWAHLLIACAGLYRLRCSEEDTKCGLESVSLGASFGASVAYFFWVTDAGVATLRKKLGVRY
jgi:hypothetical protein